MVQLGDVITRMRMTKDVSLQQMANEVGISKDYLWMIEKNQKKPSHKVLQHIADYFNLPVSALLFEVLQAGDISDKKMKRLFDKAKPLVDRIVELLINP